MERRGGGEQEKNGREFLSYPSGVTFKWLSRDTNSVNVHVIVYLANVFIFRSP